MTKQQYIKPEIEVVGIPALVMISTSTAVDDEQISDIVDLDEEIYADPEGDVLGKDSSGDWDDLW